MAFFDALRDIRRIKNVVGVMFKYELGYFLEKLDLKNYLPFNKKLQTTKFSKPDSIPKRLRLAIDELNGGFVKLGQLLSLRPDLIPKEYCEEFSKLQDNVNPLGYRQVKAVIENEFKMSLNKLFLDFGKEPIASASIGQVHKAQLKTGEFVAVKVQRPDIENLFEADIDLMYKLAKILENNIPETKIYRPIQIVKEFEDYTKKELDYTLEAKNIDDFYNLNKDKEIIAPKVVWEYTKKKVLTMEFIEGKKIHEIKNFKEINSDPKIIMKNIASSIIKQILEYKIFHADPHPGNLLLLGKNKVALLDFGIVGRLNDELAEKIENVFIALMKPDSKLLTESLIDLNFAESDVSQNELKNDLSVHLSRYYSIKSENLNLSEAMYDLLAIARKHNLQLPDNFVLLIKSLITTEGLAKIIYPEFNFIEELRPYTNNLIKKKSSTMYVLGSLKEILLDFKNSISNAPREIKKTVKAIQSPKVKIYIDDTDIQKFVIELDRSSNRITFGLIIAALLVGAALVFAADLPPYIFNLSLMGIIFLIVAMIVSIMLISSIRKEGRFKR